MDDNEQALYALTPKSPRAALEELARLKRRQMAGEALRVPYVTLHLTTGRDLGGFVFKIEDERGSGSNVLFHVPGPERARDWHASYIPLGAIVAVTVHDAAGLARPPADLAVPSRLELKRTVAALATQLSELAGAAITCEIAWDTVTDDQAVVTVIADLVTETEAALTEIAGDELGRGALREKLCRVSLAIGESPGTRLTEGALEITTRSEWPRRLARAELRQQLEKLL